MILSLGESLMDMVGEPGCEVALPGGSPYNVALAVARLGGEVAFLGAFSEDDYGGQLFEHLESSGVDLRWVQATPLKTTLAFVSLDDEGGARYVIELDGTAACALGASEVGPVDLGCQAVHVGSFSLFTKPMASAVDELLDKIGEEVVVSVDPNLREHLVKDADLVRRRIEEVLAKADIVKCSEEDLAWMSAGVSAEGFCLKWAEVGASLVVVTGGEQGAILKGVAGEVSISASAVEVVDTIGAGDTFQAGILAWLQKEGKLSKEALALLTLDELKALGRFAAAAAALACSRKGCDPPRLSELNGVAE